MDALLGRLQSADAAVRTEAESEASALGYALCLSRDAMVLGDKAAAGTGAATNELAVFDGAVPLHVLCALDEAFQADAPFLASHGYVDRPRFFSFAFDPRHSPCNVVEQVIAQYLHPLVAPLLLAHGQPRVWCEWWVHARDPASGHQMHFDTNESRIVLGQCVLHPVISSVLVVNPGCNRQPLLVARQRFADAASEAIDGWLVDPSTSGRLVAFDGGLLHGVIPQAPLAPQAATAAATARVTLMTGWWPFDPTEADPRHGQPGPNRALKLRGDWGLDCVPAARLPPLPMPPVRVPVKAIARVWTALAPAPSRAHKRRKHGGEFIARGGYLLSTPTQVQDEINGAAASGVAGQVIASMRRLLTGGTLDGDAAAEFARVARAHANEVGMALHVDASFLQAWLALAARDADDNNADALAVLWACARHGRVPELPRSVARCAHPVCARALVLAWCFGQGEDALVQRWFEDNAAANALLARVLADDDEACMEALIEIAASAPPALSAAVTGLFG